MIQSDRIATRRLRRRSRKMKSSKYVSRHYGSYIHTRRVAQARHFCRYHHSLEPVFCVPRLPIVARGVINRYYDPSTGQFLSVDPLVAYTNLPYSYAGDNPINFNDPLGLCSQKKHCSWWNPLCAVTSAWHAVSHFVKQHKRLLEGIGIVLAGAVLVVAGVGLTVGLAAAVSEAAGASELGIAELIPHVAFIFGIPGLVVVGGGYFIYRGGKIIFVGYGNTG